MDPAAIHVLLKILLGEDYGFTRDPRASEDTYRGGLPGISSRIRLGTSAPTVVQAPTQGRSKGVDRVENVEGTRLSRGPPTKENPLVWEPLTVPCLATPVLRELIGNRNHRRLPAQPDLSSLEVTGQRSK